MKPSLASAGLCLGKLAPLHLQGQHMRREAAGGDSNGQQQQQQAPGWQKWLKSAGKKVAQTVKETAADLQARLEDLEPGHRGHRGEEYLHAPPS